MILNFPFLESVFIKVDNRNRKTTFQCIQSKTQSELNLIQINSGNTTGKTAIYVEEK